MATQKTYGIHTKPIEFPRTPIEIHKNLWVCKRIYWNPSKTYRKPPTFNGNLKNRKTLKPKSPMESIENLLISNDIHRNHDNHKTSKGIYWNSLETYRNPKQSDGVLKKSMETQQSIGFHRKPIETNQIP